MTQFQRLSSIHLALIVIHPQWTNFERRGCSYPIICLQLFSNRDRLLSPLEHHSRKHVCNNKHQPAWARLIIVDATHIRPVIPRVFPARSIVIRSCAEPRRLRLVCGNIVAGHAARPSPIQRCVLVPSTPPPPPPHHHLTGPAPALSRLLPAQRGRALPFFTSER